MSTRRSAFALTALLLTATISPALAQDAPPAPEVVRTLAQVGYPTGFELTGLHARQDVMLPLNPGFRPEGLVLRVVPAPVLPTGYVRVSSSGRVLGQQMLPKQAELLHFPLTEALVRGHHMPLTFEMILEGADVCEANHLYRLNIDAASTVAMKGHDAMPADISAFFPPHLERVTAFVPDLLGAEAVQAMLWLSAFLPQRYDGAPPFFSFERFSGDYTQLPTPRYGERLLVWEDGAETSLVALTEPLTAQQQRRGVTPAERGMVLRLGSLREARQLFQQPYGQRLAIGRSVSTEATSPDTPSDGAASDAAAPVERATLADLGYTMLTIQGQGSIPAYYNFSMAAFGPSAYPVGVRLRAQHTPVAPNADATLHLYLNGSLLRSTRLQQTQVDEWFTVPRHLLRRDNTMEVRFQYFSDEDRDCLFGGQAFTATIDPSTTFSLKQGDLLAPGFDRFPQVLLPTFGVYLEAPTVDNLNVATRLLGAMQASTRVPLTPNYQSTLPVASAAPAGLSQALVAVGGAALPEQLNAPLQGPGFTLKGRDDLMTRLAFEPSSPFAVLQAYEQQGRNVMVMHHTPGAELTRHLLLDEILRPNGWFDVHGDLAVRGADGEAITLRYLSDDYRIEPLADLSPQGFLRGLWPWSLIGAVMLLGLTVFLSRRRKKRS